MRIHLFCLFSFVCISSIAQTGYWYETDFIELWADENRDVFIQTKDSLDASSNAYAKTMRNDEHFEKISENRFFISKLALAKYPSFRGYVSKIYKDKYNSSVVVLPDIIISLHKGFNSIDDIIAKNRSALKLKKTIDEDTYLLSCELDSSDDVLRLSAKLNEMPGVNWCEPDMISDIKTSNTFFSLQYYLQNDGSLNGVPGIDINVIPAWNYITGDSNICVAVIDDGVDRAHPDLTNISDGGYTVGYPSLHGEPINANTNNTKAHGTACAGIIGATDNSIGIKGVASGVTIIPVNIFPFTAGDNYSGICSNNEVADAIEWAYPRADILSCSWGKKYASNRITQAITKARTYGRNGKGSVIVAGSGNDYPTTPNVAYPASLDGVIAVGGITRNGTVCSYSQRGANLDLVALTGANKPTGDITTTDISGTAGVTSGDYITYFSGTSAACPQVAGVAALMLSINPDLTESEVRSILTSTARKLSGYTYVSGRNNETGYGLVDAEAAVIGAMKISITGPAMLCSQDVYTINNIPSDAIVALNTNYSSAGFSIQVSSNLNLISYSNGSLTVQKVSDGRGYIKIYYKGHLLSTKEMWVGGPVITDLFYDGNYIYSETDYMSQAVEDYYWIINGVTYHSIEGRKRLNLPYGTYNVEAYAYNSCGRGPSKYTQIEVGSGGYYTLGGVSSDHQVTIVPIDYSGAPQPLEVLQAENKANAKALTVPYTLQNAQSGEVSGRGEMPVGGGMLDFSRVRSGLYMLTLTPQGRKAETFKVSFK